MRILVISTLSDLQEGLLSELKEAGHDLVAVVPSVKRARSRPDLDGFALFEGDSSCPGEWQQLVEGAEVVLHLAYSTPKASETEFEPRHVLRADSVFQTSEAIGRIERKPLMMRVALGSTTSLDDPSNASVIRERLERIAAHLRTDQVDLRFIDDSQVKTVLAELSDEVTSAQGEEPVASTREKPISPGVRSLALPLDAVLDPEEPAATLEMLHELARDGVHVVLFGSSGLSQVVRHRETLRFARYVILGDGSALFDLHDDEVVRTELLEPMLLEELIVSARSVSPRLSIFSERGINLISDGSIPPLAEAVGILGDSQNMSAGSPFDRPATRLFIQGPPSSVGRVQQMFSEGWWKSGLVALLEYHPGLLGVLAPTADRSIALQRIETLLGVPRRSSAVFVSSPLDAGMLEIYSDTWAFGPFSEVIGRHAGRRFPSETPLRDLLKDFSTPSSSG